MASAENSLLMLAAAAAAALTLKHTARKKITRKHALTRTQNQPSSQRTHSIKSPSQSNECVIWGTIDVFFSSVIVVFSAVDWMWIDWNGSLRCARCSLRRLCNRIFCWKPTDWVSDWFYWMVGEKLWAEKLSTTSQPLLRLASLQT